MRCNECRSMQFNGTECFVARFTVIHCSVALLAPKFVIRTKFGERSATAAQPRGTHFLHDIRCTTETQTFKKLLKSYLCRQAFNVL